MDLDEHDMWESAFLSVDDGRWLGHLEKNPQPEPEAYPSFDAYIKALIAHHSARRVSMLPEPLADG